MSYRKTELSEGDWLRIAEVAYNTYWQHRIVSETPKKVVRGVEWKFLPANQRDAWVAAVKSFPEAYEEEARSLR